MTANLAELKDRLQRSLHHGDSTKVFHGELRALLAVAEAVQSPYYCPCCNIVQANGEYPHAPNCPMRGIE